jgi:hypothetical protein
MTEYVILIRTEGANWKQAWIVAANNPKRALKLMDDLEDGEYVAVPKRSWKPFPVKTEKTTKVHIG